MLQGFIPWPHEDALRYRQAGYWKDIALFSAIQQSSVRRPEKVALVYQERRITYKELNIRVEQAANLLAQSGLQPRERVVLQLPNIPEFVTTFLALLRIGVIPVMALPPHRNTEIRHYMHHAQAVGYIIPDVYRGFDYRAMAEELRPECPTLRSVYVVGTPYTGQISITDDAVEHVADRWMESYQPIPDDVAFMLLSGGTTALPKLIPRTHNDYVYNFQKSGIIGGINENTVYLAVLPLAHNYTLGSPGILATLDVGGTVVLSPNTDSVTIFQTVEKEGVTVIAATVPLISAWINSPLHQQFSHETLEVIQSGGARLAPAFRKRVQEQFEVIPQEIFGTAEGLLCMTRLGDEEERILNSSGAPISDADQIKIVNERGQEVEDGEEGELWCRGPYTICGYYNAPEQNARAFSDGFYKTGDMVYKRGRYIYAEGRKNDLINRGGEKISCAELENLILRHPKVKNVAVVAMPDERFGEKACAYVVVRAGEALTFHELSHHLLQQQVAKFKCPERLEVVDEFPLSAAGKVLRRDLRTDIARKLAEEKHSGSTSP